MHRLKQNLIVHFLSEILTFKECSNTRDGGTFRQCGESTAGPPGGGHKITTLKKTFFLSKIDFLGFQVSGDGIKPVGHALNTL